MRNPNIEEGIDHSLSTKIALKDRFQSATKNKTSMSPKVLETWINETL